MMRRRPRLFAHGGVVARVDGKPVRAGKLHAFIVFQDRDGEFILDAALVYGPGPNARLREVL